MPQSAAVITIRVHPGASRSRVGADRAGAGEAGVLGVWVTQRAVEGRATEAALRAVAEALGVRPRSLRLVTGARARVKVVALDDPPPDLAERLARLSS